MVAPSFFSGVAMPSIECRKNTGRPATVHYYKLKDMNSFLLKRTFLHVVELDVALERQQVVDVETQLEEAAGVFCHWR